MKTLALSPEMSITQPAVAGSALYLTFVSARIVLIGELPKS